MAAAAPLDHAVDATTAGPGPGSQREYWDESARIDRINAVIGSERLERSQAARCIAPLLIALDWFGAPRTLASRLPTEGAEFSFAHLDALLGGLGFSLRPLDGQRRRILQRLPVPTLAIGDTECLIYLGRDRQGDCWHDGTSVRRDWLPERTHRLFAVERDIDYTPEDAPRPGWLQQLLHAAGRDVRGVLFISLFINVLALGVSLFVMTVYNTVIPGGARGSLLTLAVAAALAVGGGFYLRVGRLRILSQLGAWAGARISTAAFRKTLGLPAEVTERSGVSGNVARLRSLDGLRQYLGGTNAAALIDYPFVVIFLVVIALLGGWIVVAPIVGLLVLAGLAFMTSSALETAGNRAGRASTRIQQEANVLALHARALQGTGGYHLWLRRLRDVAVQAAEANRDFAIAQATLQSTSQAVTQLTVLGTLTLGILLVLNGDMSPGGLIAAMMLIWRVTGPAQQLFATATRYRQILASARQLDRLMTSAGELINPQIVSPIEPVAPAIAAENLFYRYGAERDPALNGVTFEVKPGERLAVVGPNGAGKSTLLQCLVGLRAPQNGRVRLSGRDIRQFDPTDYRAWVGYYAERQHDVPIDLLAYVRLGRPASTRADAERALVRVAGARWWQLLGAPDSDTALQAVIDPWSDHPDARRQRYIAGMASAILEDPPLMILDDPTGYLDADLQARLMALLDAVRGRSTVVLATHEPALISGSDCVAVLDWGNLVHFGPVANDEQQTADAPTSTARKR